MYSCLLSNSLALSNGYIPFSLTFNKMIENESEWRVHTFEVVIHKNSIHTGFNETLEI